MAGPRSFPVGRSDRTRATRSGNPGPGLLTAIRQADRITGASKLAGDAYWSATHPRDRVMGRGRAANPVMEVPWVAGRPWYHGSARRFEKPDPERFDRDAMYGPGHYITDDPAVASSYAGKGEGHLVGNQLVERAKPLSRTPEWAEFFKRNPTMPPRVLHPLQTGHRLSERVARKRAEYDKLGFETSNVRRDPSRRDAVVFDFMAKDYGPNVTKYAFEPDKVFDIRAPVTPAAQSRLVDALMAESKTAGHEFGRSSTLRRTADYMRELGPPNAMNAYWHALEERLGAKRANDIIRRAGYDAIAYPGGAATGNKPHNALVVLNQALLRRGAPPNPKYAGTPRPVHRRDT